MRWDQQTPVLTALGSHHAILLLGCGTVGEVGPRRVRIPNSTLPTLLVAKRVLQRHPSTLFLDSFRPPASSGRDEAAGAMAGQFSRDGAESVAVPRLERPKPRTRSAARETVESSSRATKTRPVRNAKPILPPAVTKTPNPESANTKTLCDGTSKQKHDPHVQYARQQQNRVGKRYRDRLGAEFEKLHAALRMHDEDDDDDEGQQEQDGHAHLSEEDGKSRKRQRSRPAINKTRAVELARERVATLVRDCDAVRAERDALMRVRVMEGW